MENPNQLPPLYDTEVISHADYMALMSKIYVSYTTRDEFFELHEKQQDEIKHMHERSMDYARARIKNEGKPKERTAIAFQPGTKFRLKNDIEGTVYIFSHVEILDDNETAIHCRTLEERKETILMYTGLFDLEHA